jgi:hypothetical protein
MRRTIQLTMTALVTLLGLIGFSAAQDTNFPNGPQYLINGQSPLFLHAIETPSLSFGPASAVATPTNTGETVAASPVVETPRPLPSGVDYSRIFWGEPQQPAETEPQVIEVSSTQPVAPLPPSILETGVTALVDDHTLRGEGYGVPLGEVAAYWKAHKPPAVRIFTNKDVVHSSGS